jgi:hypothetical protein
MEEKEFVKKVRRDIKFGASLSLCSYLGIFASNYIPDVMPYPQASQEVVDYRTLESHLQGNVSIPDLISDSKLYLGIIDDNLRLEEMVKKGYAVEARIFETEFELASDLNHGRRVNSSIFCMGLSILGVFMMGYRVVRNKYSGWKG